MRPSIEMSERRSFTPLIAGILTWIDVLEGEKVVIFRADTDVMFDGKKAGVMDWGSGESIRTSCAVNGSF